MQNRYNSSETSPIGLAFRLAASKNIIRPVLCGFFSRVLQLTECFFSHYNIIISPKQPAYPRRSSKRTIRFVARPTIGVVLASRGNIFVWWEGCEYKYENSLDTKLTVTSEVEFSQTCFMVRFYLFVYFFFR